MIAQTISAAEISLDLILMILNRRKLLLTLKKSKNNIKRLKAGEKLPPIEMVDIPGKGRYIIEGHHRYVASQQSGIPVEIIVVEGSGPVSVPYSKESILMNPNFGRIRRET